MNTPEGTKNINMDFIKAGRAVFTVDNGKGEHYTYQVTKSSKDDDKWNEKWGYTWFISLLTGPDNDRDYTYLGILVGQCKLTAKSVLTIDSKPVRVFNFALRCIEGYQTLPQGYSIQHQSKCGRCYRTLTEPESLKTGLGPVCRGAEY